MILARSGKEALVAIHRSLVQTQLYGILCVVGLVENKFTVKVWKYCNGYFMIEERERVRLFSLQAREDKMGMEKIKWECSSHYISTICSTILKFLTSCG